MPLHARCVDVTLFPATGGVSPPPSAPAILISNTGSYDFDASNTIDTSGPTFTCCSLQAGSLDVPEYAPYAPDFTAALVGAAAEGCRDSASVTAPNNTAHTYVAPVAFSLVRGSKYSASFSFGGQAFALTLEDGLFDYANTYPNGEQPIVCDGFARVRDSYPPPPPSSGGGGAVVGAAGAIGALVVCAGLLWARRRGWPAPCMCMCSGAPSRVPPAKALAGALGMTAAPQRSPAQLDARGTLKVTLAASCTCTCAHAHMRMHVPHST